MHTSPLLTNQKVRIFGFTQAQQSVDIISGTLLDHRWQGNSELPIVIGFNEVLKSLKNTILLQTSKGRPVQTVSHGQEYCILQKVLENKVNYDNFEQMSEVKYEKGIKGLCNGKILIRQSLYFSDLGMAIEPMEHQIQSIGFQKGAFDSEFIFGNQKNNSMRKVFEKINQENTSGLAQSNEIIIMNVFDKLNKHGQHVPHLLALTNMFVLYYTNDTKTRIKRIMPLEFGCKFEILKDSSKKPIGIRFEKDGCKSIQLYTHESAVVSRWEKELQKFLNKRGFHEEFKPIKKIGKGNFAAVYLATRMADGAKVAVKAFSKEHIFSQEKGRDSLINEIKLLRTFNHRNILSLLGVYESLNSIYLVLQYLQGNQLFNAIENHAFTISQIQEIMHGLLSGVAQLARRNVVHRDLKPQNLMFRTNKIGSDVVILDFGLATFCDQKEYIYTRCGTPGFVSPQIVNIKDLTTKCKPISDIFSLGVILHILLLGKSPFKGKTFNQVLAENRLCNFTLEGPEYSALPHEAYDLLCRMLQKNSLTRPSAEQCLTHVFFQLMPMEIEDFETMIVKNPEDLRIAGSTVPEDSIGKFFVKMPMKGYKQTDSIQLSKDSSTLKSVNSPKPSKFTMMKSPFANPQNTVLYR